MQSRIRTECKILRAVDGDTLLVRMICPCCLIESQQRVRLGRIDAPELAGRRRAAAIAARDYLGSLCHGQVGEIAVRKSWPDRYGRVLAEVYVDGRNLSDAMLSAGHAIPWREDEEPRCRPCAATAPLSVADPTYDSESGIL